MSLFRTRDECPRCFRLVGYAGHRARQSNLRAHLACRCDDEAEQLPAREDAERDAVGRERKVA